MKRSIITAVLCGAVLVAASVVSAEGLKLGYVDIQKAVTDSIAGKEAMEEFKTEVKKMEEDILAEKEQIEKLGEVLEKQSMMLTDDVRRNKEKELMRKQRDYERQVKDSKAELQIKEAELTNGILEEVLPIIEKYGTQNGYSIIFEKSERVLLFADEALDLTEKIVGIYDAQYRKGKK